MVVKTDRFTALGLTEDLTATIAVGQTVSTSFDTLGTTLVGISSPQNITGTKYKVEVDIRGDGNWERMNNLLGAEIEIPVPTSINVRAFTPVLKVDFECIRRIRLVSDAAQTGSDAILQIVTDGTAS